MSREEIASKLDLPPWLMPGENRIAFCHQCQHYHPEDRAGGFCEVQQKRVMTRKFACEKGKERESKGGET